MGPGAAEIGVEEGIREGAHGEACGADVTPYGAGVVVEDEGGMELVGLAAQGLQLVAGVGQAGWLGQDLGLEGEDLIAAEDEGSWVALGEFAGFGLGKCVGDVAGGSGFGGEAGTEGGLVDAGWLGGKGEAGVLQEVQPDGGRGGEDEVGHGEEPVGNLDLFLRPDRGIVRRAGKEAGDGLGCQGAGARYAPGE